MKELFLSKTNAFFCDVRPNDELWFPEVAGYEKISIFISVHDLDTQEKRSLFQKNISRASRIYIPLITMNLRKMIRSNFFFILSSIQQYLSGGIQHDCS